MLSNKIILHHDKYMHYSNKAVDWWIKSWGLKGTDKEIALLYQKKNQEKALKHLKKTLNQFNG